MPDTPLEPQIRAGAMLQQAMESYTESRHGFYWPLMDFPLDFPSFCERFLIVI